MTHPRFTFDPDLIRLEEAGRVTVVTLLCAGVLGPLAALTGEPGSGMWIGLTVAQYAAWFVTVREPGCHLRVTLAALGCGAVGTVSGVALSGVDVGLFALATVLTAGAFALRARSGNAMVAALACPYAMVFTAYHRPDMADLPWYAACIAIASGIYLLVRFGVWGRKRPERTGSLAAGHAAALTRLRRLEEQSGSAHECSPDRLATSRSLRRMQAAAVPVETRLAGGDAVHPRLARALSDLRARAVARTLGTAGLLPPFGNGGPDAAAETALHGIGDAPAPPPQKGAASGGASPWAVLATLLLVLPIAFWISSERWAWGYLTAVMVFYNTQGGDDVLSKGWTRLLGTLWRAAAGVVAAALLAGNVAVEIAAIVMLQLLAIWLQPLSYALMTTLYTALLALVFSTSGTDPLPAIELRLAETVVGAVGGFAIAWLTMGKGLRREGRDDLGRLLDACAAMLRGKGVDPSPAEAFRVYEAALDPLRRNIVALTRGARPGTVSARAWHAGVLMHHVELAGLAMREAEGMRERFGGPADALTGMAETLRSEGRDLTDAALSDQSDRIACLLQMQASGSGDENW